MATLTRDEIEAWRGQLRREFHKHPGVDALCDMALTAAGSEGVRVPREPTKEMVEAGDLFLINASFVNVSPAQIEAIYREMLAAAPPQTKGN